MGYLMRIMLSKSRKRACKRKHTAGPVRQLTQRWADSPFKRHGPAVSWFKETAGRSSSGNFAVLVELTLALLLIAIRFF